MPGKFVFPGGRIEPLDATMTAVSELHPDTRGKDATRPRRQAGAAVPRAFALAAIRETAEETGLLLGVKARRSRRQTPGEIWAEFAKAQRASRPRPTCISSRAPSRRRGGRGGSTRASSRPMRRRSRTRSKAWSDRTPSWWNSSGCRSSEAAHLDMPTITGVVLEELLARVEAGMAHDLPVPFYFMADQRFAGSCCNDAGTRGAFLDICRFGARFPRQRLQPPPGFEDHPWPKPSV